jgi:hypothetical protein
MSERSPKPYLVTGQNKFGELITLFNPPVKDITAAKSPLFSDVEVRFGVTAGDDSVSGLSSEQVTNRGIDKPVKGIAYMDSVHGKSRLSREGVIATFAEEHVRIANEIGYSYDGIVHDIGKQATKGVNNEAV